MRNIIQAILEGTPLNNRHFVFLLFLRKFIFSCEGFTIVEQNIHNFSSKGMVVGAIEDEDQTFNESNETFTVEILLH